MRGLSLGIWLNGIIIGVVIGLTIAWVVWPVTYTNALPADLQLAAKDDYLRMIAASYSLDGDMAQAMQRLQLLQLVKPYDSIADLVQREKSPVVQQALIRLALDLKQPQVALARPTFTPRPTTMRGFATAMPSATVQVTATSSPVVSSPEPTRTSTALPTNTAAPTTGPTLLPPTTAPDPNSPQFELKAVTSLNCLQTAGHPRIEVETRDPAGHPLSGIGVEVNSTTFGNEIFYTGLKPERGTGIGDVAVRPGLYNVHIVEHGQSLAVTNLKVDAASENCNNADPARVYGWKLTFQQASE